jgi:WhiB family redox-sensing transcriptional regulator
MTRLDPAYLRSVQRRVAARLDHRGDPCADIIRRMSPAEVIELARRENPSTATPQPSTAISPTVDTFIHTGPAISVHKKRSYTVVIPQADMPKMASMNWTDKALCRGSALFASDSAADQRRAAKICAACPVIEQCRQAGQGEPWGVWGGLTPAQRRTAA